MHNNKLLLSLVEATEDRDFLLSSLLASLRWYAIAEKRNEDKEHALMILSLIEAIR